MCINCQLLNLHSRLNLILNVLMQGFTDLLIDLNLVCMWRQWGLHADLYEWQLLIILLSLEFDRSDLLLGILEFSIQQFCSFHLIVIINHFVALDVQFQFQYLFLKGVLLLLYVEFCFSGGLVHKYSITYIHLNQLNEVQFLTQFGLVICIVPWAFKDYLDFFFMLIHV